MIMDNTCAAFIIATHSPIIMAYPNAAILQLAANGFEVVRYEETEHYIVMKEFMNNREKMLKVLLTSRNHSVVYLLSQLEIKGYWFSRREPK